MLTIERYGTRFWALYEAGVLLCVTVYKKGAAHVKARIERGEPFPPPERPPAPEPPPRRRVRRAY
jgi:hypothetical protein